MAWRNESRTLLVCALLVSRCYSSLILSFNGTEHVLYPSVSSNFEGTTTESPRPLPLRAPIHIITLADLELIEKLACGNTNQSNRTHSFAGKTLVVPIDFRIPYYGHCGVSYLTSKYTTECDKLNWLCSEGVSGVVVEKQYFEQTSVASIQKKDKPFDIWPSLRTCVTYRVAVKESLALPFTGRTNMTGVLSWDPDPFLSFFQQPAVLYVYRPLVALCYLVVCILAAKHLWQRYKKNKLNLVFGFLLSSAFITMLILAIGTIFGTYLVWGWKSRLHLSFQLSVYTTFLGTSIAGDFFTSILYTQLADSLRKNVGVRNQGVYRQFPVLFTLGVLILLSDVCYTTLVLIGTNLALLSILVPAVSCVMQIGVFIFTIRQTLKTANHLKRSRVALMQQSSQKSMNDSTKVQMRLERRIRFWLKIIGISAPTTMAGFGLFATKIMFRSPRLFLLNIAMASFGKIGNVLAQVMIAAPPPTHILKPSRVAVTSAASSKLASRNNESAN